MTPTARRASWNAWYVKSFLLQLSKPALVGVMFAALYEMGDHDGKSQLEAIMVACGAKEIRRGKWNRPNGEDVEAAFGDEGAT